MRARLGFSIATAITPDILLLDEVLGTGDQTFRARSQARVRELVGKARAIVLVTHDLTFVTRVLQPGRSCSSAASSSTRASPRRSSSLYRDRVAQQKAAGRERRPAIRQHPGYAGQRD